MDENDILNEVIALLEDSGALWRSENGRLSFRLRRGGLVWDAECRAVKGRALFYGRYPFACGDAQAAADACSRVNARSIRGAMFLTQRGEIVFRTDAELDDPFGAKGRLVSALAYNAAVISHFWSEFAGISG